MQNFSVWYTFSEEMTPMAHSFTVTLTEDIASVLRHVESSITGSGGSFQGNSEKGAFQGHTVAGLIRGEYCSVSDKEIKITITNKPFIVPYGMIETEIRRYFG